MTEIARDLVIIEAPGKLKTLRQVFAVIGLQANVYATIGHFLENPQELRDIAIAFNGDEFVELKRVPQRPSAFESLRRTVAECKGRLLIATDNDAEGHVIAQDVLALSKSVNFRGPVYRLLLSGLDVASVKNALNKLAPCDLSRAAAGNARRITDRIIASCFSDFDQRLPVGRVQSAMLGMVRDGLPHGYVTVEIPSQDGKPFVGELPLVEPGQTPADLLRKLNLSAIEPLTVGNSEVVPMSTPLNGGDALLELNEKLGLSIMDAANMLQQMYEAGEISYPRTNSHGFTEASTAILQMMAHRRALSRFNGQIVPKLPDDVPHESIRLLDHRLVEKLDLGKPLQLHASVHDAALSVIGRRCMTAGIPVRRDTPELSGAPAWMLNAQLHRDSRTVLPWREDKPQVRSPSVDAILVAEMIRCGVGRPSTWASHASKFVTRAYVDDHCRLTPRGSQLLAAAPSNLTDVLTSARIEALLEREDAGVTELVESALNALTQGNQMLLEQIADRLERIDDEELGHPKLRFR